MTIFDYPDGRFVIKHQGRELPYRIFDKVQQVDQAAIVENKRLGPVLAYIAERQKQLGESRSKSAPPWRPGQEHFQGRLKVSEKLRVPFEQRGCANPTGCAALLEPRD